MATSAPPMTTSGLEGLEPADNLAAIRHTTAGPSTTYLGSTIAQLPVLQGYNGNIQTNDNQSKSELLGEKAESEQELNPSVSDFEDEQDAAPGTLNISERRKVQNGKFSAWCVVSKEVTASGVDAHRTKQVIEARGQDHE